MIAGVVNVHFEVTADQALQLSRALAAAAANAVAATTGTTTLAEPSNQAKR